MNILINILTMTVWTTLFTTISIMVLALTERRAAVEPVNSISHIVYGDRAFDPQNGDAMHFAIGFCLNIFAMIGWSAIAELFLRLLHVHQGVGTIVVAVAVTVLAYFTDFHVVPKRFTPGFEHILSHRALLITYGFLAVAFVIGGMMRHS